MYVTAANLFDSTIVKLMNNDISDIKSQSSNFILPISAWYFHFCNAITEQIAIISDQHTNAEWWYGSIAPNAEEGWIPASFLQPI